MEEEPRYAPPPFCNLTATPGARRHEIGHLCCREGACGSATASKGVAFQGTDSLIRATQSIECPCGIASETHQVGSEIREELGEQPDQLGSTKNRLVNTSENLSKNRVSGQCLEKGQPMSCYFPLSS